MKSYISVNVVSQALILIQAIRNNSCNSRNDIDHVKLPYGIIRNTALSFIEQCMWMSFLEEKIVFSERGIMIGDQFNGAEISNALWREILMDYITICEPAWANRIPYGRKEAYIIMNMEEQRCFDEAGLMDSSDNETVAWWDLLANIERKKNDAILGQTGRRGEQLTIQYEQRRTGATPVWVSIDSNLSGYDILSIKSYKEPEKILIEVKTSLDCVKYATCLISRNEWKIAKLDNNIDRYLFYLWSIHDGKTMLSKISVKEMEAHMPSDRSAGKWETAKIPFTAFADSFCEISIQ